MTTVGVSNSTPKTDLGREIASLLILPVLDVLYVPTGSVVAEMSAQHLGAAAPKATTRGRHACLSEGHRADSKFCRHCGAALPPYQRN